MKSTTQKRLLSLLLALVMLFGLTPALEVAASAADSGDSESAPKLVSTYAELSAALSGGVSYVKLNANIDTTKLNAGAGYLSTIVQSGTVSLDLNGHTVCFFSKSSPFQPAVRVKGSLTIKDSKDGGKMYIQADNNAANGKHLLFTVEGGTFTLNSGTLGIDNGSSRNSLVVVQGGKDAKLYFNGGKIDARAPRIGIPYVYSALLMSNSHAEFNGGEYEGLVGFTYPPRSNGIYMPNAVIRNGKFKGGIVVKAGADVKSDEYFPIRILGGKIGRGLFTEGFELRSDMQTANNIAFASIFPERTALLRPGETPRLIYRQKDIQSEYMSTSISKEYLIALSVSNLSDYRTIAFTPYPRTVYTEVYCNAFGMKGLKFDNKWHTLPHQMDVGGYAAAPLFLIKPNNRHLYFWWFDLPRQMEEAGYTQKRSLTIDGKDVKLPSGISLPGDGTCGMDYPVLLDDTGIHAMAFTLSLRKDGEPLILNGAANQFLMRYRQLPDTVQPLASVSLQVKDGDLVDSDDGTVSPVSVSENENCTLVQQVNWADNGTKRNKTVTLKAKTGYYFTDKTVFTVEGAHRITAKYLYSSDGGTTCAVGLEAQECEMIYTARGIVRNLVYRNRADDVAMDSFDPEKYTITVKEVGEYVSSTGSSISDAAMWPHELLGTDQPYYLYCTVEAKPGYVFRSGTSLLKYAMPSWKQNHWVTAVWDTDWRDCYDVYIGACYKTWDKTDTNLGGLWVDRILLDQLYLTVKAPRAGEKPAPGSAYCQVEGLPEYIKLERVDWLKCYDDWRYYSDRPFSFEAGVSPHYEDFEYQCFIHVSFDAGGVMPAKNARFYLNDTPCRLSWDTADKFFYSDPMLAFDSAGSPVIAVKAGANGTVTPSGGVSVKAGESKTFTFQPNAGYAVSKVLVDGKNVGAATSYTFTNVRASHTLAVEFSKADTSNPFVDVPAGAYYYDAVLWAVQNGITTGVDATHFNPSGICTRAQAVTFLWRAAGKPAPKSTAMPFDDVPKGSYYESAVLWAVENGITNGTGAKTFSPNANCSRSQIVTFLWRSRNKPASGSSNPFADVPANAFYTQAVLWAVDKGVTKGTGANTFSPNADCSRGQIVTFIHRAAVQ